MDARFVVSDDRLRTSLVVRAANARDLTTPLEGAGALVQGAAVFRIRDEGQSLDPPWIPSRKTQTITLRGRHGGAYQMTGSGGRTGVDTGNMMRSITWNLEPNATVKIGTNVPYAKWFQFGSGVYAGRSEWTITPRDKRALSWVFGGRRFFARSVTIAGQPPRPFLYFDQPLVDAIIDLFRRHTRSKDPS